MSFQQSTLEVTPVQFADPDWRGEPEGPGEPDQILRPSASLAEQERRLTDWIRGGSCYGWLNAYQVRRATFELQSIRAQRAQTHLVADCRGAIQSRLDRLDEVLSQARAAARR
jgi:hypothetical protein